MRCAQSIWSTGQKLAMAASLIEAAGLYNFVHEYVKARQNPETGLWGEGLGWMNTNGAMKLSAYFQDSEHPYPRIDRMFNSVLAICPSCGQDLAATGASEITVQLKIGAVKKGF